jgi:hypothetical protein
MSKTKKTKVNACAARDNEPRRKFDTETDRRGKPAYTLHERLEQQIRIRDGASNWMENCVILQEGQGLFAARTAYEHAISEIKRLEKEIAGVDGATPRGLTVNGLNVEDMIVQIRNRNDNRSRACN